MAQTIGTVSNIQGSANLTRNGITRPLVNGELVYPSDLIQAELGSQITLSTQNGETLISNGETLTIPANEAENTDISALQAQIAAGEDPTQVTDATAAGNEASETNQEQSGHNAVYVTQNASESDITAGFDTVTSNTSAAAAEQLAGQDNIAPIAENDTVSITEQGANSDNNSSSVSGNVISNDIDPEGRTLTVTSVNGAENNGDGTFTVTGTYGTLTINADGTYNYVLNNDNQDVNALTDGQTLADTFNYIASDGSAQSSSATLDITINGSNDAPVAESFTITPTEGGAPISVDFDTENNNLSDAEDDVSGAELQVVLTSLPTSGTLYYTDGDTVREITESDLNTTQFEHTQITYSNVTTAGDKETGEWGEVNEGAITPNDNITITSDGGVLTYFDHSNSGKGLGVSQDGEAVFNGGIESSETIDIAFNNTPMTSLELGLDGVGGVLDVGDASSVSITLTYEDGSTESFNYQRDDSSTIFFPVTFGDGDAYDFDTGGQPISNISLTTEGNRGNWVLRYLEGTNETDDAFDYKAVDSDGTFSEEASVIIDYDDSAAEQAGSLFASNIAAFNSPDEDGTEPLQGAEGSDTFIFGEGYDTLTGDSDANIFKLTVIDDQTDTISNFNTAEGDTLDLTEVLTSVVSNFSAEERADLANSLSDGYIHFDIDKTDADNPFTTLTIDIDGNADHIDTPSTVVFKGVDLSQDVTGTGENGMITNTDIINSLLDNEQIAVE